MQIQIRAGACLVEQGEHSKEAWSFLVDWVWENRHIQISKVNISAFVDHSSSKTRSCASHLKYTLVPANNDEHWTQWNFCLDENHRKGDSRVRWLSMHIHSQTCFLVQWTARSQYTPSSDSKVGKTEHITGLFQSAKSVELFNLMFLEQGFPGQCGLGYW